MSTTTHLHTQKAHLLPSPTPTPTPQNNAQHSATDHFPQPELHLQATLAPEALLMLTENLHTILHQASGPLSTAEAREHQRSKRKQVKNACVNCQKACKKCDDCRPCTRCVKYNLEATCKDSPRKERRKSAPAAVSGSGKSGKPNSKPQPAPTPVQPTSQPVPSVSDGEIEAAFIRLTAALRGANEGKREKQPALLPALLQACAYAKAEECELGSGDDGNSCNFNNEQLKVGERQLSRVPTPPTTPSGQKSEFGHAEGEYNEDQIKQ